MKRGIRCALILVICTLVVTPTVVSADETHSQESMTTWVDEVDSELDYGANCTNVVVGWTPRGNSHPAGGYNTATVDITGTEDLNVHVWATASNQLDDAYSIHYFQLEVYTEWQWDNNANPEELDSWTKKYNEPPTTGETGADPHLLSVTIDSPGESAWFCVYYCVDINVYYDDEWQGIVFEEENYWIQTI